MNDVNTTMSIMKKFVINIKLIKTNKGFYNSNFLFIESFLFSF